MNKNTNHLINGIFSPLPPQQQALNNIQNTTQSVKINPCKACLAKFNKNNDPQNITGVNKTSKVTDLNNCCYETLAAFTGTNSVANINSDKICQNCITDAIEESRWDRDRCNDRITPGAIIDSSVHLLPKYLNSGVGVKKALELCKTECQGVRNPNECIENCETDASAVEGYENTSCNRGLIFYLVYIITLIIFCILIHRFIIYFEHTR